MTEYSPLKKFLLSICCAFLLLIYAPLASVVGNDLSGEIDFAVAQTQPHAEHECLHEDDASCEKCADSDEENVLFDEIN